MQEVLTISNYVIHIWWAIIIVILVIILIILIAILYKMNSIIKDFRKKYFFVSNILIKPTLIIEKILNRFKNK